MPCDLCDEKLDSRGLDARGKPLKPDGSSDTIRHYGSGDPDAGDPPILTYHTHHEGKDRLKSGPHKGKARAIVAAMRAEGLL